MSAWLFATLGPAHHSQKKGQAIIMRFLIACMNDAGRRNANQDSLYYAVAESRQGSCFCAAVCDGMGGMSRGGDAGSAAVRLIDSWFSAEYPHVRDTGSGVIQSLQRLARESNRILYEKGEEEGYGTGTTCAMICGWRRHFQIMNIGDSRVYLLRKKRIRQLTKDQTLAMCEVETGKMRPEFAENSPESSVLIECLGVTESVTPGFFEGKMGDRDCFLVCSDGFRRKLKKEEMAAALSGLRPDPKEIGKRLRALAAEAYMRGETDNMTAIAILCLKERLL